MGDYEREVARENPGAFERELELFREFFERGEYDAAVRAVKWCAHWGLPLPAWLEAEACAAMEFYFAKGGAAKRGSKGHLARTRSARIDVERYRVVERERAKGLTKDQALDRASILLAATQSRGSAGEIHDSYNRVAPRYSAERRKPGPKPRPRNSPP